MVMTEKRIKKIVKELAINELERSEELSTELTDEDIEDIDTLNEYNGIQDIELTIIDICKRHQAHKTIAELEKEDSDMSQKELIRHLKNCYKYVDRRHLSTVANCSNNPNLTQILKDNYYWLPRDD